MVAGGAAPASAPHTLWAFAALGEPNGLPTHTTLKIGTNLNGTIAM